MRLSYVVEENAPRLTLDREPGGAQRRTTLGGIVDVGEGGRLLGVGPSSGPDVELARALAPWPRGPVALDYGSLSAGSAGEERVRGVAAELIAELDAEGRLLALSIPRWGAGYEIAHPSGNP